MEETLPSDKTIMVCGVYSRSELFHLMFSDYEQTAIINALFRRSKDDTDKGTEVEKENEGIKLTCHEIAMEIFV